MSFEQLPQIDEYSEYEDQGNNRFTSFFSQRNGFLSTKPTADKGCDYIVELIAQRQAKNWRFPVQIKSIQNPTIVKNGEYISYSFKASGLHYLLEAIPPVGLIIIYHPDSDRLYFEYAENIYSRILAERPERIDWTKQEYINIHVPTENFINDVTIKQIHDFILTRHENSRDRSPSLYPLKRDESPAAAITSNEPVNILKNQGLTLYYDYQLSRLKDLLDEVSYKMLRDDPHLSLLAGITYSDMGMYVEADYFLATALQHTQINADDRQHAHWAKIHNDSNLGKISQTQYNEEISSLLGNLHPSQNQQRLHYELCITRNDIELLGPSTMKKMFDLADRCYAFDSTIATVHLDPSSSVYFRLLNALNLGVLLLQVDRFFRHKFFTDKLNGTLLDRELYEEFSKLVKILGHEVETRFAFLKPLARNFVHPVMLAKCLESQVSITTHQELNVLRYPLYKLNIHSEAHQQALRTNIRFAKEALDIFIAHGHYYNAYNITMMLLELTEIAIFSEATVEIDMDDLRKQCDCLQQKIKADTPKIQAQQLIADYKASLQ